MSTKEEDKGALLTAFAAGVVAVAEERGLAIDSIQGGIPDELWPDVCERLNETAVRTAKEKPWRKTNASRYWSEHKDTLIDICRALMADRATDPTTQRIVELWNEGIPVPAIVAVLTQEGFTTEAGEQFSLETVARTIDANEGRAFPTFVPPEIIEASATPGLQYDGNSPTKSGIATIGTGPTLSDFQDPSIQKGSHNPRQPTDGEEAVTRGELDLALGELSERFRIELTALSEAFRKELISVADAFSFELKQSLQDAQQPRDRPDELPEPPPAAPLRGLKKLGTRVKIAGTIDKSLMDLIEAERKSRNVTLSAMIDLVAWHYFDKPLLSFQAKEPEE